MNKGDLIQYLYAYGADLAGLEDSNNVDVTLSEKFQRIDETTSYTELLALVKQGNALLGEEGKNGMLEEYLQGMAKAEQKKQPAVAETNKEDKEKMMVAQSNMINQDNPSREATKDYVAKAKENAEANNNFIRIHISLSGDNKIKVDITQFGDNIKGNEMGYSLLYDRYKFNNERIMDAINDEFIANDKVNASDNQRFYNGHNVETNVGHQLIIDSNVREVAMQTENYVNEKKKGNARVRKDDHDVKEAANANVLIVILMILILTGIVCFFVIFS